MKKIGLLLIFLLPLCLFAQDLREIKGKVVDMTTGEALPGASVYIDKSTIATQTGEEGMIQSFSLGTTTDIDGNFTIHVPKDLEVLFSSFISYETSKVNIKGKNYIIIKLTDAAKSLQDVIVTGYQVIEKRKLTSSVVKVSVDKILQGGVSSVDQMLGGQLAGVQTSTISGAPGAPAKIRIRGTASLSGSSDPLWVLDGMPLSGTDLPDMSDKNIDQLVNSSIAGLNPNDIADITILKDAAATAIYGARAANGVIVITTKKGRKGKMRVSLSSNTTFVMRPDFDKLNLMNSNEKVDFELNYAKYADLDDYGAWKKRGAVARILTQYSQMDTYRANGFKGISSQAQNDINALRSINTNWGNELYQTAINQDHSVSISGGTDDVNYYFSAGYYDEKGATVGTGMDRFNLTFKADYQLHENLNVGAAIFSNQREQSSYLTASGSFTNPSRYSRNANPYLSIRDANGEYNYDKDIDRVNGKILDFNIFEERKNTSNTLKSNNLSAVFDLDWKIIEGLNLRSQLGMQNDKSNAEQYGHKNSFFSRREREKSFVANEYFIPEGGVIKNWETTDSQWNLKNMLEYKLNINDMHEVDVMIGNELRRTEYKRIFSAAYGFNKETLTSVPFSYPSSDYYTTVPLFNKSYVENAYVSFFGTLAYTYNKKYTFFGSVRMDGSNLFGVDPKYRYLPLWAASGAWRAKKESWLADVEFLSDLKFRASYGLQGNIDKGTSKFIIGDKKQDNILPDNRENVIVPTNLPNDRLRWEKTATWNAGFDLGLFSNILRVSADFYHRESTDLIGTRSIPLENGMSTTAINWAALTNKGFELNLITRNIYTPDFKWQTTFNISKNINTVDKIQINENQMTPSIQGHSVNSLFAIKTAGLDEQGYIQFDKDGKKMNAEEFFQMFDSWGGNGTWGHAESKLSKEEQRDLYTHVGNRDPEFTGGLINKFTYKNFTLNISCSYNIGQWIKTTPFYNPIFMDRGINRSKDMSKVWSPDNKGGTYPRLMGIASEGGTRPYDYLAMQSGSVFSSDIFRDLDIWYKEVNFLRVSSIRLGYTIPKEILSKWGIAGARINLETRNPFVFATNYDGYFDPETLGNIYAQPMSKTVTVGVNLTF
jgi:TonB-linked SusC/RagA family outer membrane protein